MTFKGAVKTTRNFFADFDMFAANPSLRANEQPFLSSFCTGIFSFLLTVLFFYIFVNGMVNIGNYKKIESVQTEGTIKADQAKAENLMFAIGIDTLEFNQIYNYFDVTLEVVDNNSPVIFSLKQCSVDQWTMLGEQYKQIFDSSGLENFLCPATRQGLSLNRTWLKNPKTVKVILMPCTYGSTPQCVKLDDHDQKMRDLMEDYGFLEFYLFFLDQNLAPEAVNPLTQVLNIDNSFSFTPNQGVFISVYLGTYGVQTDVSLMPWQNKKEVEGTFLRQVKTGNFERNTNTTEFYVTVTFQMAPNKIKFDRKVGKIDDMLSYAGGLFAIIISVLAFFLMSYNEYKYQLMIAERMFNFDTDGNKIKQSDMTFINYMIYSILDWVDALCCVELRWPYFQKIHHTRDEVNKQLDVTQLFRKIQNIEVSLLHIISQQQKDCLALTETQTIHQLKRERLISQYYQTLIEGKAALTLEDIRNIKETLKYGNKLAEQQKKYPEGSVFGDRSGSMHDFMNQENVAQNDNFDLMYEKACKMYPQIVKEASEAQLEEEMLQIETVLRQSFYNLNENMKKSICWRIPIKILFRLKRQTEDEGQTEAVKMRTQIKSPAIIL